MRYLLFCNERYYPKGGWNDFISASNDVEELVRLGNKELEKAGAESSDWWQVVDTESLLIVASHGLPFGSSAPSRPHTITEP